MGYLAVTAGSLILLMFAARSIFGSWGHPTAAGALLWAALTSAVMCFAPEYSFSPGAGALLLACLMSHAAGAAVTGGRRNTRDGTADANITRIVGGKEHLENTGRRIGSLRRSERSSDHAIEGLQLQGRPGSSRARRGRARFYACKRYEEDFKPPLLARLLTVPVYASVGLVGLLWGVRTLSSTRAALWIFAVMAPSLLVAVVQTARAAVLFNLLTLLGCYWGGRLYMIARTREPFVSRAMIMGCVSLAGFVFFLLYQCSSFAVASRTLTALTEVLSHLKNGHLALQLPFPTGWTAMGRSARDIYSEQ